MIFQIYGGHFDVDSKLEEIKKLDEEDKRIIYSRYYYDMTQSELSKELGISQVQVSRKESKILQKLKTRLQHLNFQMFFYYSQA